MINRYIVTSLFLLLLVTVSLSLATSVRSEDLSSCGSAQVKLKLDTTVENNFNFGKTNELVLLEGTCSQLKSGACGTGTCEKGGNVWTQASSVSVHHHSSLRCLPSYLLDM
ncbi:MAG: hypothetical protein DHS20C13_07180 [Thermodesulfobacteriota bacterium]|nr:MAG: hypothetical protein DHS20C13_07180 [Thermodesulfobacteriota bacterium]